MGREVRRVALDFDWPLNEVWSGFLMPETLGEKKCGVCDGSGYSGFARELNARWYGHIRFEPYETGSTPFTPETPAVRAFAERNVTRDPGFYADWLGAEGEAAIVREARRLCAHWNGSWSHHLDQDDVDALVEGGRLYDFTHTWVKGDGWQPRSPQPVVTAAQVNLWSISGGFGHDSINNWICVRARCERAGRPYQCGDCDGHGSREAYRGQRAEAEAWQATDPPSGDGWQLWETVSEGSPISPVFPTANELAEWMSDPARGDRWLPPHVARKFIDEGWAPSLVFTPEAGVVSGAEFIGTRVDEDAANS